MSVLDKLRAASTPRRTYTIPLDAALRAEHDQLVAQLEQAAKDDARDASMASSSPNTTRVVDQLEDVRERMQASSVTFVIDALGWTQRVSMQAEHPPRDGQAIDQLRGYNVLTFVPALIKASTVEIIDNDGDKMSADQIPDDVWDHLFAKLNFGGINQLGGQALAVNDEDAQVPSSARSLPEIQDSGASLAQPSPGTSRRSGSAGGSRRGSRKSTATKKAASSG